MINWFKGFIGKSNVERYKKQSQIINSDKISSERSALVDYLTYYCKLDNPGFAVLVTGAWGVGKSFQIKELIEEENRYYVSLYGLETVAAINDAVLAECLPSMKINDYLSAISDVGKAAGEKYALAGFANSVWTTYLRSRLSPDRILIFDDLERSSLWEDANIPTLLGVINHYVEHGKFRVIVICHDEKIADRLAILKEKTFGHTIKVKPQIELAFDSFLTEFDNVDTKQFLSGKKALIREIWGQSGQSSLRILKHVLADIGRLHGILEQRHKENPLAIDHLLKFFIALDIEVRSGREPDTFLLDREMKFIRGHINSKDKVHPINVIRDIYPNSDITGNILSDELLQEMLIEGKYSSRKLSDWLEQTHYFIKASDAAPWQIVISFDTVEEDVLQEGIQLMQAQFDTRSVTNKGEFLHIAALRLMMAEAGVLPHDVAAEEALSIEYIQDLIKQGRMPPTGLDYGGIDRSSISYAGHGYWDSDSEEFKRIAQSWRRAEEQALQESFPIHAANILEILKTSPSDLFKTIADTPYNYNPLSRLPILLNLDVNEFMDAWLNTPRANWRDVSLALDGRYKQAAIDRDLYNERNWVLRLSEEFDRRVNGLTGLNKYRLQRIRPKVFDWNLRDDEDDCHVD